jgi:hypothetical protein
MPPENVETVQRTLLFEIWGDIRPYVRCIVEDFLLCAIIWVPLWALSRLEHFLAVPGWASAFIHSVHGLGAVMLVVMFFGFLIDDVYQIRIRRRR